MNDNLIKCEKCGVILVDPRRQKIRSCAHYPVTIEKINSKFAILIGIKTGSMKKVITDKGFNFCFENIMNHAAFSKSYIFFKSKKGE